MLSAKWQPFCPGGDELTRLQHVLPGYGLTPFHSNLYLCWLQSWLISCIAWIFLNWRADMIFIPFGKRYFRGQCHTCVCLSLQLSSPEWNHLSTVRVSYPILQTVSIWSPFLSYMISSNLQIWYIFGCCWIYWSLYHDICYWFSHLTVWVRPWMCTCR